ncbi:MAG: hypothetical protein WBA93_28355, partial [Microcoleaceae cyanobacterium]
MPHKGRWANLTGFITCFYGSIFAHPTLCLSTESVNICPPHQVLPHKGRWANLTGFTTCLYSSFNLCP